MTNVAETFLIALGPGTFEGLLAVAIVLSFRSTGVVNAALGMMGALGAVAAALLAEAISPSAALIIGVLVSSVCAAGLTLATSRHSSTRRYPWSLLATAVVAIAVFYALDRTWDASREFPVFLPERLISVGPYQITPLQVIGVVSGIVVAGMAAMLLRRHPDNSRTLLSPVFPNVWVVLFAGAVGGFSAICMAEGAFGPDFMEIPSLVALLAASVARLRSPVIAFLAAVVVEVIRNLTIHFRLAHSGYTLAFIAAMLLAACLYLLRYAMARTIRPTGRTRQRLNY